MTDSSANVVDDQKRRRFLWGVGLAWAPWIPTIIGLAQAFRGIAKEKATGLAAIAGGLTETLALFGLVATMAFEVGAIALLFAALDREHWFRSLFSVVSICLSALMLLCTAFYVWFVWHAARMS